jgi:hypothetical protein
MEALKIVCNHHDVELIKENKILNQKIEKVEFYFKKINNALDDILWVSRRPNTKEMFLEHYADFTHIDEELKEKLWKKCVDTRKSYKTIFNKLEVIDEEEEFDDYLDFVRGVIGGIRHVTSIYYEIMDPYVEDEGECDVCDDDCKCNDCGLCYECSPRFGCKCPRYLNQLEEELFELQLNLDS